MFVEHACGHQVSYLGQFIFQYVAAYVQIVDLRVEPCANHGHAFVNTLRFQCIRWQEKVPSRERSIEVMGVEDTGRERTG